MLRSRHLLLEALVHRLPRPERVPVDLSPPPERGANHGSAVGHVEDSVLLQNLRTVPTVVPACGPTETKRMLSAWAGVTTHHSHVGQRCQKNV